MIIALLVCLAATVTTGLMGYGEQSKGPLAAVLVTDAKANGKPRALNFTSIKKSALGGGLEIVRVIGVCTTRRWRNLNRLVRSRDSLRGTGDDRCLAEP
jgi:hypothetical protein